MEPLIPTGAEQSITNTSRHIQRRDRRHRQLHDWARVMAPQRDAWIQRNSFYYDDDRRYMRFLVPEGKSVLELGCGTGQLLASLQPSIGVGLDVSREMITQAEGRVA